MLITDIISSLECSWVHLDSFLDSMLRSRITRRVLAEQVGAVVISLTGVDQAAVEADAVSCSISTPLHDNPHTTPTAPAH